MHSLPDGILVLEVARTESLIDDGHFSSAVDFLGEKSSALEKRNAQNLKIIFAAEFQRGGPLVVTGLPCDFNGTGTAIVWRVSACGGGRGNARQRVEALKQRLVEGDDLGRGFVTVGRQRNAGGQHMVDAEIEGHMRQRQ